MRTVNQAKGMASRMEAPVTTPTKSRVRPSISSTLVRIRRSQASGPAPKVRRRRYDGDNSRTAATDQAANNNKTGGRPGLVSKKRYRIEIARPNDLNPPVVTPSISRELRRPGGVGLECPSGLPSPLWEYQDG